MAIGQRADDVLLSQFRYHSITLLVYVCPCRVCTVFLYCVTVCGGRAGGLLWVLSAMHAHDLTHSARFKPRETPLHWLQQQKYYVGSQLPFDSVSLTPARTRPAVCPVSTSSGCLTRERSSEQPRFCACVRDGRRGHRHRSITHCESAIRMFTPPHYLARKWD